MRTLGQNQYSRHLLEPWNSSIGAVENSNQNEMRATYSPRGDTGETADGAIEGGFKPAYPKPKVYEYKRSKASSHSHGDSGISCPYPVTKRFIFLPSSYVKTTIFQAQSTTTMLIQLSTILFAFLGLVGTVPVFNEADVGEELHNLTSRQTGHQEYIINLDEKSQPFWLELAYGDAFSSAGIFKNPIGDDMKKYFTLKTIIKGLLHPSPPVLTVLGGPAYRVPHGKCRVLYCSGENLGVSLCSRRQGEEPEVSINTENIGMIVEEWADAFKWQRALPKPKTDGGFITPIYGRSFWSEDPGWSINIEECGATVVEFGQDVLRDT
ncbi:hypothetical protein TWF506_005409 [Arthrobotrys conoides]|uniref:Uncharacterized protein n=1 Tax=Arthrobotrys conoides TaxID=74498 RepID=A0AAN8S004_9PEZI